jgi:integrase
LLNFSRFLATNFATRFRSSRELEMTAPKNMVIRNGRYYARLAVPKNLRPIIGKRELTAALGSDRRQALRDQAAVLARMQAELDAARMKLTATSGPRANVANGRPMYPRQIAQAHYAAELQADDAVRIGPAIPGFDPALHAEQFRPAYRKALVRVAAGHAGDDETAAVIQWAIDGFAMRGNVNVDRGTAEWRSLARTLAGVQLEVLRRQVERDQGDYTGKPTHLTLTSNPDAFPSDPLAVRRISPQSDAPLSDLAEIYIAERKATPSTSRELVVTIRMLDEYLGEQRPAYRLTRADVRGFIRALAELPNNYTKRFPGATLPDAIKANKDRKVPFPVLNSKTINDKYMSRLNSLLGWCVKGDILPDNPAAGVKIDTVKQRTAPRVNFSPGDLTRVFKPENFGALPEETRWAMLISLFAGTRASETAQLELNSIRHERGILVFRVEEETKNLNSQRLIPVHQTLIDLGLEWRIKSLRSKGQTHLFPEWYAKGCASKERAEKNGKNALNLHFPKFLPRRFNVTYLPKVGIADDRKSWHSWRHTFRTAMELAGISKPIADLLMGHADGSMASVYTHERSVEKLKEAIDKLQFDGFQPGVR